MLLINKSFPKIKTAEHTAIKQQTAVLQQLLKKAKNTEIGKIHQFEKILFATDLHGQFQKQVPIYDYELFYQQWIKKSINGRNNIFWPDKINFYALSSGTTSSSSKLLPISNDMLQSFFRQSRHQLTSLKKMGFQKSFYTTSCLTLGGSTDLIKEQNLYFGDLSGILQKNTPYIYRPFKKPGGRISALKDWNEKLAEIIKKAPKWNIGTIAGIPNWIVFVLDGIIKHYNLKSIHDIWPNFQLCLHGGIELGTYKEKIESLCSKPIVFLNTYLASEGYFAYQTNSNQSCMRLLFNNGIYYEFIAKKDFEKVRNGDFSFQPLCLSEVEVGVEYGLVITTNSGLWRYIIGDTIKFTSKSMNEISFQGRIQQTMNAMGEHLTLANLTLAVQQAANHLDVDFSEFCVQFDSANCVHIWYLGATKYVHGDIVAPILDLALQQANDDYKHLRKYTLKEPMIKVLPKEKFEEYLAQKGKLGGQHKFPRVLNPEQAKEWNLFLHS